MVSQSSSNVKRTALSVGTPSSLLPHPPKDRVPDRAGSNKQRIHSGGRDRQALSGKLHYILECKHVGLECLFERFVLSFNMVLNDG